MAARSSSATNWQTPLRECTRGPPSPCVSTSSPVTSFTTPGPVRNMLDASVITTKSFSAGEYAPPPAATPAITAIWGTRPDRATVSWKMRP